MDIPDDPDRKSLVSSILEEGYIYDLVSEINALSRGIELTETDIEDKRPGAVCVFETGVGKNDEVLDVHKVNTFQ